MLLKPLCREGYQNGLNGFMPALKGSVACFWQGAGEEPDAAHSSAALLACAVCGAAGHHAPPAHKQNGAQRVHCSSVIHHWL